MSGFASSEVKRIHCYTQGFVQVSVKMKTLKKDPVKAHYHSNLSPTQNILDISKSL